MVSVEVGRTRARLAILGVIPSVLASSPSGMVADDLERSRGVVYGLLWVTWAGRKFPKILREICPSIQLSGERNFPKSDSLPTMADAGTCRHTSLHSAHRPSPSPWSVTTVTAHIHTAHSLNWFLTAVSAPAAVLGRAAANAARGNNWGGDLVLLAHVSSRDFIAFKLREVN